MEKEEKKEKEIQISIKIRVKDMFYFMMYHTYCCMGGIFSVLFSLISFFILFVTWKKVDLPYSVLLAICALLFTVINPVMLYIRSMKQVAMREAVRKPILYTFTKKGFTIEQDQERASAQWNEMWKIVDKKQYILLYGDRVHANILPKDQMQGRQDEISALIKESRK